jgi:mediator of RNA polymerase II transcription subunit 31
VAQAKEAPSSEKPDSTSSVINGTEQKQSDEQSASIAKMAENLPKNRFELELEFVQALASPAYLHYLSTNASSDDHNWLDDPEFIEYLRYLHKTWTRPEYNRFLVYPQGLYFLEWLLNHRREEWAQVGFRNFAHQQQFMSWQHRASGLYGKGSVTPQPEQGQSTDSQGNKNGSGEPQPMQEG